MAARPIRFLHRGAIVAVEPTAPTRTVLEWLREDARCTGTKEGCAEGDCGACTVVVGELVDGDAPAGVAVVGGVALRSVNACIQFLPMLDGKALFTVEDLKRLGGGELHPAQQAMLDCHGSQCGFCTPGFVMSLWATYERHHALGTRPSRGELADDLAGNLCRCTGYRPILDAGERMFDAAPVRLDARPVAELLRTLAADPPLREVGRFHAPRTLDDLAALRQARPDARIVAGATDAGLWVTKQLRDLGEVIHVGRVAELQRIATRGGDVGSDAGGGVPVGGGRGEATVATRAPARAGSVKHPDSANDEVLVIGAAASLEDAWRALVARWPSLQDMWLRFASPPVRHAGTMGGNVANGSPIGDSAPVLMALGASVVLRQGERVRTLPLRDFHVDYMKNRLERGEFVQAIEVPLPHAGQQVRAYKVSKRFDSDISAVCAGLAITLDGDRVRSARFAFGGMAATVRHAAHAEADVADAPWNEDAVARAMEAIARDFTPLTDMRGSAAYRLRVARNLLYRFWLETRRDAPLAADAVSVWSGLMHEPPGPVALRDATGRALDDGAKGIGRSAADARAPGGIGGTP